MLKGKCQKCGKPVCAWANYLPRFCADCAEAMEALRISAKDGERAVKQSAEWSKLCPSDFREVILARLPNRPAYETTMRCPIDDGRGIMLYGASGRGKTRSLYAVLKREHFAGRRIQIMDHSAALRYAALFSESSAAAWEWLRKRATCDILALDDIFKSKLTESFEQALFTIISTRTEWKRPILLTTQDVGRTLESRMSADRGVAMVRRLREFCEQVSFA